MVVPDPVFSEPTRAITIVVDIIVDEYGNEYIVYDWHHAEITEIQNPSNKPLKPTA